LILADVMMPELDGFSLAAFLKSNSVYSHIPVVLLSARSDEISKIEGLKIGADDYLVKPFSAAELHTLIDSRVMASSGRIRAQNEWSNRTHALEERVIERTFELQQSKALVNKQNVQLEEILNAIPQMVWVLDASATIRFINERWSEYTGQTRELSIGNNAKQSSIFHALQKREISEKWEYLAAQQKRYIGEVMIRNSQGEYRWHLDITEPILDEQGNLEMIVGTFTDVHEQFLMEKEAIDTRDTLQAVFNASKNSILVCETKLDQQNKIIDFHCTYFNEKAAQHYGTENLKHRSLRQLLKRQQSSWLFEKFKTVVALDQPLEVNYQAHVQNQSKSFHVTAVKLGDGLVITLADVTEAVEAKQKLLFLNDDLKQKNHQLNLLNEELTNYAFIASHDLREPLRKIRIFISQLIEKEAHGLSERGKLYGEKIQVAATRMNDLIEDILLYSKASVRHENKWIVTDLNEILHNVLEELSETIQCTKARIEHTKMPMFKCNPLQIFQLMQNLISNALKFQPVNQIPVIAVHTQVISGEAIASERAVANRLYLKLEVSDNGIGFEKKYMERIFGIFQRLNSVNTYPGTGIGLAICRKIVENHHGFIVAQSTEGTGSVFTCYLPFQE
jgi:PAS domain S-box-containing protein